MSLWNKHNCRCEFIAAEHTGAVNDIVILIDGSICSCSSDKTLKIWHQTEGSCIRTMEGHTNWVLCLSVTSTHKIVSGSYDNTIRIWVMKGECINILYGHDYGIYSLCVLSSGVLVSGSADAMLKFWDLETGIVIDTLEEHKENILCLTTISESINCFASGSLDRTIRIWKPAPSSLYHECVKVLEGHTGCVRSLCELSSNRLASASGMNGLCLFIHLLIRSLNFVSENVHLFAIQMTTL